MSTERLQKILSRTGIGSRRKCDNLIAAGRVTVNGEIARLGQKVDPTVDKIQVDGNPIETQKSMMYIALYKPRGILSSVNSPDPRQSVKDIVGFTGHIYPVGRLDLESEGLILLTNDGELTNKLTHPRYKHEKEYRILVSRRPDNKQLTAWRRGVVLEDGYRTAPAKISVEETAGKGTWLKVILREGKKRQIREMGALTGLPVKRIIRTRIGTLQLGKLKSGQWRHLSSNEIAALKRLK